MAYCRKCGTELNNGVKFCPKCGNNVFAKSEMASNNSNNRPYPEENSMKKMVISVVCVLLILAVLIGGWLYNKSTSPMGATELAADIVSMDTAFVDTIAISDDFITALSKVLDKYEYFGNFSEGLAQVSKDGKEGFIDKMGKEIVPCVYDYVSDFHEGLACVIKDSLSGFIDKTGKVIIPFIYDDGTHCFNYYFSGGVAAVMKGGKWGLIDKTGKGVTSFVYDYICEFSEGLACVAKDGKYGFVDKKGKEVIPFIYKYYDIEDARRGGFSEGLARVRLEEDEEYGFIDKKGEVIIPCVYDWVGNFHEGLALVQKDDKYGYIDKTGEEITPFIYEYRSRDFSEGIACVKKGEKWGFVDKSGNEITPFIYDDVGSFHEGLARVGKIGRDPYSQVSKDNFCIYGYIDKTGKEIIPCIYTRAESFHEGLAIVGKGWGFFYAGYDYVCGYIDKTGKEVIPLVFRNAFPFYEGLAKVEDKDGRKGFLDKGGKNTLYVETDGQTSEGNHKTENFEDLNWLQGHWVYEHGSYKGHFVIQGNTLSMFSTMNPEPLNYSYKVVGNELIAGEMTVKLDFTNQRIDFGDGQWMRKIGRASSDGYSSNSSSSSSQSRTFTSEQSVTMYLANQTFKNNTGVDIRIDGSLRMYIDGDYAGVVSVQRHSSTSALIRYGGGVYGEGYMMVNIENGRLKLSDTTDGTTWYQK